MNTYADDGVYDYSLFETVDKFSAVSGSAAAAPEPVAPEPAPETPKRRAPKKARRDFFSMRYRPWVKVVFPMVVFVVLVTCCAISLTLVSRYDDISKDITEMEEKIALEKTDNTTLTNRLNIMFSKRDVEFYAENVLGMTKVDRYNTIQLTLPKTNEVVLANGKNISGVVSTTSPLIVAGEQESQNAADGAITAEG